jgi:hypothetical protein
MVALVGRNDRLQAPEAIVAGRLEFHVKRD